MLQWKSDSYERKIGNYKKDWAEESSNSIYKSGRISVNQWECEEKIAPEESLIDMPGMKSLVIPRCYCNINEVYSQLETNNSTTNNSTTILHNINVSIAPYTNCNLNNLRLLFM